MDKTDYHALKSSRDRVQKHEGVKTNNIHQFSLILFRFIRVTKELAMMPIKGHAKSFNIPFKVEKGKLVMKKLSPSDREDLIVLMRKRMGIYDVGVSPELVEHLLDPSKWTLYRKWWVCLCIGEVMNAAGKLLGSLSGNKMKIKDENGKRIMRAHIVLLANGQLQPDGQSADHIEHEEVLNDSITNLRWATNPEQNFNHGAQIASTTFKTATGTLLPAHPK